jgi:hypothetical protein
MASIECDRCPNEVYGLTHDEFDQIVDADPSLEYEAGRIMLRCTAWPQSIRDRLAVDRDAGKLALVDGPVPLSVVVAGMGGW